MTASTRANISPGKKMKTIIVSVIALLCFTSKTVAQSPNSSTNSGVHTLSLTTNISIFFGQTKIESVDDLVIRAKAILAKQGCIVDETYSCSINIVVAGEDPGCAVDFTQGIGKKSGFVYFGPKGEVKHTFSGIAKDGTPSRGAPPPKVPKGAVPVEVP